MLKGYSNKYTQLQIYFQQRRVGLIYSTVSLFIKIGDVIEPFINLLHLRN